MNDWTAGYVADVGYTYGYYNELNPTRIKLAFLNAGLAFPEVGAACELGFGQGLSANIHAAASVCDWHGTDFNPAQAGYAKELASVSGAKTSLLDQAFDEFCRRDNLPDFDYIGLHGIWSWISDENRRVIVEFIRRKLKVGGVLYVSYNTLPGWAAFAPMRHLMTEHAEIIGAAGHGIVNRINDAVDFAERLLATNPLYSRANPQIAERLAKLKEQNRHYLAHEYFNKDWTPMHFADMKEWLSAAKLTYACSANYSDHINTINLTGDQQAFLAEIPDKMFRESTRDFMVNQQFRRDYWVKGARQLSSLDVLEQFRAQRLVLVSHRPDVSLKVSGALGEATMSEEIYGPILDLMSDHTVRSVAEIEASVATKGVSFAQLREAVLLLAGLGHLAAVMSEKEIELSAVTTDRLNQHLMKQARASADVNYLASPVTGGGVAVSRFQQLFLMARKSGCSQPEEWAEFAWRVLSGQGQRILKDGRVLEKDDENLAELQSFANEFALKRLKVLEVLRVA